MSLNVDFIVKKLGGTTATADLCECTPSAVSQWKAKQQIPKDQLKYLRVVRPDVFAMPGATVEKATT